MKNMEKKSIETFLKNIAKIQFFEENQCRTMLYCCISRIFYKFLFETLDNKNNIYGVYGKVDFLKIWGVFSMKNVKNRQ